jgi:hypothetical protein
MDVLNNKINDKSVILSQSLELIQSQGAGIFRVKGKGYSHRSHNIIPSNKPPINPQKYLPDL